MYDELVKRLRNKAETERWLLPHSDNGTAAILDEAADAIEELRRSEAVALENLADEHNRRLELEQRYRWIPVTERKPKTDDIVIVAIHDDSGDTPYDRTDVGFYLDVQSIGVWVVGNERCNYITSWMPLPEPPKEGKRC